MTGTKEHERDNIENNTLELPSNMFESPPRKKKKMAETHKSKQRIDCSYSLPQSAEGVQSPCGNRAFQTGVTVDRFDTELFINEVEKRPAIWDTRFADYANKSARNRAWQEVVELLGDGEDSLEKKSLLSTMLQKKWKNIRDAYNKEYKKDKIVPSVTGARKGAQYMYFARLSFLQKCFENKKSTNYIEIEVPKIEESQTIKNEQSEISVNTKETRPKRKKSNNTLEERLSNILEKSIQSREKLHQELISMNTRAKEDEDKLFCLSLYEELKKVPKNLRLITKIELLQEIQKGQTSPSPDYITDQHTVPNPGSLHSKPNSKPQRYFTSVESSSVMPTESQSPSLCVSSDSQSSIIENIYADIVGNK